MKKILACLSFSLAFSGPAVAQNQNFEFVAFIMCGSPNIALSMCLIDSNNQDNNSSLDLTNFAQRTVYSFQNVAKVGTPAKSGTGVRLSQNFKLVIKNVNPNVGLSVKIYKKDDPNTPVFQEIARYNQTINVSN